MRVTWEIQDGYVGKARPQYLTIPDEEFDGVTSEEEKQEIIEAWIEEEFRNSISWEIVSIDEDR